MKSTSLSSQRIQFSSVKPDIKGNMPSFKEMLYLVLSVFGMCMYKLNMYIASAFALLCIVFVLKCVFV